MNKKEFQYYKASKIAELVILKVKADLSGDWFMSLMLCIQIKQIQSKSFKEGEIMSLAEPRTDREYEARWDAETLANAERIKADPEKLAQAQSAAKAMAEQQDDKQRALRKVAGRTTKGSLPPSKGFQGNPAPAPSKGGNGAGYNVFQKI